ncbi:hypothetical protein Pryu01_03064 [Paraliobacillus ryukyuensis]|uniref:Tail protein n=1 Tax=Paraliobacillus ryukyuensis TaxID=200904 RepID=A0A366DQX8_9BACI|nr:phage tail domain-containing protein [Paraliobacillus ryukyuensis]RBO92295.1 tail protein [Paraliobacillus ryukyuensis]
MFKVYDKNMKLKTFPSGLHPLDIYISKIRKRRETTTVEGKNGFITNGVEDDYRNIELEVLLISDDSKDYRLLRDETYDFFNDAYFYVVENYQQGKRYKVTALDLFIPERANFNTSSVRFSVENYDSPYAESIGTSQDIQANGIDSNEEIWGFGMGLSSEEGAETYTHTGTTFSIYNPSNIDVLHPFEQELKITIDNVIGSTSYLQLENTTTGDAFRVNEAVNNSQVIALDGPAITSNSLAFLRKTNKQYITLVPGWNEFVVTGATSAKVAFDFRFYYL